MLQSYYIRTLKAVITVLLFTPFSLIAGCACLLADENSLDALMLPGWMSNRAGRWFGRQGTVDPESVSASTDSPSAQVALSHNPKTLQSTGYAYVPAQ